MAEQDTKYRAAKSLIHVRDSTANKSERLRHRPERNHCSESKPGEDKTEDRDGDQEQQEKTHALAGGTETGQGGGCSPLAPLNKDEPGPVVARLKSRQSARRSGTLALSRTAPGRRRLRGTTARGTEEQTDRRHAFGRRQAATAARFGKGGNTQP
jgi:hypothetical protein